MISRKIAAPVARRPSAPAPAALILMALFILWGFGIDTVGRRLVTHVEGVVISRQIIPRQWYSHGTSTIYVVRGPDGIDHQYVAGATDASLPRNIPVGAYLTKHQWELSYLLNGKRIDDFPRVFYSVTSGIALACLLWGGLLWMRGRE